MSSLDLTPPRSNARGASLSWFARFLVATVALAATLTPANRANAKKATPLESLRRQELAYQAIAAELLPSVVQVLVDVGERTSEPGDEASDPLQEFRHFFDPGASPRNRGQGSGFMVAPPGTVVTNAHVVRDGAAFTVRLDDGRETPATLVGVDPDIDLAVLGIDPAHWHPARWGDSGALAPGSIVMAFGSPYGLRNTVTHGIVSGLGRRGPEGQPHAYVQTDATIDAGSSGGPLVNIDGAVVGVNTYVLLPWHQSPVAGFAIPANLAREVIDGIVGHAADETPAWLGCLSTQDENPGVGLFAVLPGTPAARAGLGAGDRILSIDGVQVESSANLRAWLANRRPGNPVTLRTTSAERRATLARRPPHFQPQWHPLDTALGAAPPPLRADELSEALQGRGCPCPCGRTLQNCFGCSAAKSDLTDARGFLARGLDAAGIHRLLTPPVTIHAWVDYSAPESRRALRALDTLAVHYGDLIRIRRRYFPTSPNDLEGWSRTIRALEVARAQGQWKAAHDCLVRAGSGDWRARLEALPDAAGLDPQDLHRADSEQEFSAQIRKDLTAGPSQYGVRAAPTIEVAGRAFSTPLDAEALTRHLEKLILDQTF